MAKQLEVDASAEEIMDAYLPAEYRNCYQDLPVEQCTATPPSHIGRKVKDILQSPTNTVSTVASSVVSSLTLMSSFSINPLNEALSVPFPREAWSAPRRASLVRAGELRRGSSGRESSLLLTLKRELDETKKSLRKLEAKVEGKDLSITTQEKRGGQLSEDDQISTTSTEAVSGGEILHSDPWNDSIRSFMSSSSAPLEFLSVPEEVSVACHTVDTPSDEVLAVRTELKKSERHTKLLEAKLRASEAVASTLFKSLTDIRKKQRIMERLNKDRASCEDVELMLHHCLLLLCMGPLAFVVLAAGYTELFAAIVVVLSSSLEVVSEDSASS